MRIIFKTLFGSHLYGLDTPESDRDYKAIAIPDGKDILMQKAFKTKNTSTKPKGRVKNTSEDMDMEVFSLHEFLKLCREGQTIAMDMLFAPRDLWLTTSPEWEFIIAHRDKMLHKKASAFVGYCQNQAAKYGIKGSRVAAVRMARDFMKEFVNKKDDHGAPIRLIHIWSHIVEKLSDIEHIHFITTQTPGGDTQMKDVETLEVCNRKIQAGVTCKHAHGILSTLFNKYGERAKKAETNEGVDWKAISHAFRVCYEAQELFSTGKITFPLADREFVLEVKKGKVEYQRASKLLESHIALVKVSEQSSTLPDEMDNEFWERFLLDTYKKEVSGV